MTTINKTSLNLERELRNIEHKFHKKYNEEVHELLLDLEEVLVKFILRDYLFDELSLRRKIFVVLRDPVDLLFELLQEKLDEEFQRLFEGIIKKFKELHETANNSELTRDDPKKAAADRFMTKICNPDMLAELEACNEKLKQEFSDKLKDEILENQVEKII
mmetsp:Transcript_17271/g.15167  ORF Transcript_17271/g.15167 Transcript_17271/m.15167 type:complete len:161 (-) Transcript_17271:322-804(-)